MSRAIAAIHMEPQNEKLEGAWILNITDLRHQPGNTCIFCAGQETTIRKAICYTA